MVNVSWNDAVAYAKWLSVTSGNKITLPTEAQWEYAARGKTSTVRFWGDGDVTTCRYANVADQTAKTNWSHWRVHDCSDGYAVTAPVGSFKPNRYGLHDMLGNVWEWCSDWYGKNYYSSSPRKNPQGPSSGTIRIFRGGSWGFNPRDIRAASRSMSEPGFMFINLGFRLVLAKGSR